MRPITGHHGQTIPVFTNKIQVVVSYVKLYKIIISIFYLTYSFFHPSPHLLPPNGFLPALYLRPLGIKGWFYVSCLDYFSLHLFTVLKPTLRNLDNNRKCCEPTLDLAASEEKHFKSISYPGNNTFDWLHGPLNRFEPPQILISQSKMWIYFGHINLYWNPCATNLPSYLIYQCLWDLAYSPISVTPTNMDIWLSVTLAKSVINVV